MKSIGASGEPAGTQSGSPHYEWRVPGAPVHIWISLELVRRIREYLAAHAERSPGTEAGGFLLGKPHPPGIEINDFAPLFRGDTSGPPAVFSDEQKTELPNRIEGLNRRRGGLSVVGYFRSDMREGVRLYDADLAFIREFFPDHSNVFLVIKPGDTPHPTAGFFFWDGGVIFSSFSFMEFSFHESVLASAAPAPKLAIVPAVDDTAQPEPAGSERVADGVKLHPPPVEEVRTHEVGNPAASRRWVVPAGIAVALGLGLGAYVLIPKGANQTNPQSVAARTASQASPMGLSVSRSGTEMSIIWNGQSPLVTDARVGMLTIEDGNSRHELPLTPAQLLSSRLVYSPKGNRVHIALEIFANDGKVTRESLIAVATAGAPTPTATVESVPYRVEVPVDRSGPQPQAPSGAQVSQRKPVRDFVPPPAQTGSPAHLTATAPAAEPPSPTAPRIEALRMDMPVVQLSAPLPAPIRQEPPASSPPAEKATQPVQAVSQPTLHPPVPVRQSRPVLPLNVKAMLTGRVNVKVRIRVDATGKVESAEPLDTAGSLGRYLGSAAAAAARTWTFEPATIAGRKVPGELTVEFVFVPER